MEKQKTEKLFDYLIYLLIAGVVLVNLKSILVDADIDTEYEVVMSYRMLQGDAMFRDMWEPHQTSAFLCTILMWIYQKITGGTTGVLLFLHSAGVVIHGALTAGLYGAIRKKLPSKITALICIFFMTVRPKGIVFPEYSNMQIWFQVLLFLCLLRYFENGKRRWLIAGSVSLFLEAISYPSCVLVWIPAVILISTYGRTGADKRKDIGLFTGSCLLIGGSYTVYYIFKSGGIRKFWWDVWHIVIADESHSLVKDLWNLASEKNMRVIIVWIITSIVGTAITYLLWKFLLRRKANLFLHLTGWLLGMSCVLLFAMEDRYLLGVIYVPICACAFWGWRFCTEWEKRFVACGLWLSFCSVIATFVLTNLLIVDTLQYLVLAVLVSFVPVWRLLEHYFADRSIWIRYGVLAAICFAVLLRRGVIIKSLGGYGFYYYLGGVVANGPATGLVTDYMGARISNATWDEWENYVQPGDCILIVGDGVVNTLQYTFSDTMISVPSTICTPTYNEELLAYWNEYPERYPDVVIVKSQYGELQMREETWIMQWLLSEYQAQSVQDGTFWRYYRKNAL